VEATEEPYFRQTPWQLVQKRVRWLVFLFVAQLLSGAVLRTYDDAIQKVTALAWFIPLLIGSGGNAGAQTTTTITRAIALGEVRWQQVLRVMGRELRTGLLLGSLVGAIGILNALVWTRAGYAWEDQLRIALTVGLAQVGIITLATTVGACLPLIAKRLNIDPAVMSAPFITTIVDASGLLLYFTLARLIVFN
jgi:magnesium transporter